MFIPVLLFTFLLRSEAQRGYYRVSYSSNVNVISSETVGPMHTEYPDTPGSRYVGGGTSLGTYDYTHGNPPRNIPAYSSLSGTITITLNWVGKNAWDMPPQEVVIEEYCDVLTGASGNPYTSSDNGFAGDGSFPIYNASGSGGRFYDIVTESTGRHYRTNPSQSDIASTFSNDRYSPPSLPAEISWTVQVNGFATGSTNSFVGCLYLARAHTANIDTLGTTDVTTSVDRLLSVGQSMLPQILPYYDPREAIAYNRLSVRWTFDNAKEPFFQWNKLGDNSKATMTPFPYTVSTNPLAIYSTSPTYRPETHWSYTADSTDTQLYGAAILNIGKVMSGNTVIDPGVDLKFKLSQKIIVKRPIVTFETVEGNLWLKGNDAVPPNNSFPIMQARKSTGEDTWDYGDKWTGYVLEDPIFETFNTQTNKRVVGQWCFVQLIKPQRTILDQYGNNRHAAAYNTTDFLLDIAFPYGSSLTGDTLKLAGPDADGNPSSSYTVGDSPTMQLASTNKVNNMFPLFQSGTMTDEFNVYLMYQPPASSSSNLVSQWVPLKKLIWNTNGTATSDKYAMELLPILVPGGTLTKTSLLDVTIHPTWMNILTQVDIDAYFIPVPQPPQVP